MTYVVHILAGGLRLVFGYVALYAAKGAPSARLRQCEGAPAR
jgi:hypothetical protein